MCARRGGPIQSAGGLQASNTFFCGNGMAKAMPFPVLSGFRFARSRRLRKISAPVPKDGGHGKAMLFFPIGKALVALRPGRRGEAPARS